MLKHSHAPVTSTRGSATTTLGFFVLYIYIDSTTFYGGPLHARTKIDRNLKLWEVVDTHGGRALKGFKKFWPRPMTS